MPPTLRPRAQNQVSHLPSPSDPADSGLPLIDKDSSKEHIPQWLAYIAENASSGPYSDLIHVCSDRVFGFKDGQDRTNSTSPNWYPGDQVVGTLNEFMQAPRDGKKIKLGLFCSWPETWVGKSAKEL
jgi:hypothetical protein